MSYADPSLVDGALLAALRGAVGAADGHGLLLVGDAQAPEDVEYDAQRRPLTPYSILYGIAPGSRRLSFGNPDGHVIFDYQVTTIGARPDSTRIQARRIRARMLDRAANGGFLTVISDASVISRSQTVTGGLENTGNGLFQVVDRFALDITS